MLSDAGRGPGAGAVAPSRGALPDEERFDRGVGPEQPNGTGPSTVRASGALMFDGAQTGPLHTDTLALRW